MPPAVLHLYAAPVRTFAALLMGGWGWLALLTVAAGQAGTANPYYALWGAVFAGQGTVHLLALTWAPRWNRLLAVTGAGVCSLQAGYYILYALGGHATWATAWIFVILTAMHAWGYRQERARVQAELLAAALAAAVEATRAGV